MRQFSHKKSRAILPPIPGSKGDRSLSKVGTSDLSRLAWLLDALNDAEERGASEQNHAELEAEANSFCEPVGSVIGSRGSRESLNELLRELGADVRDMLKGSSFDLEIPSLTLAVMPTGELRYMGTANALFRLAVAKLLEGQRQRIKVCARPGCSKLFVRRKRGLYCSRRCSQIEQFARFVDRHGKL